MQRTLSRVRCEQVGSSNIASKPALVNPAGSRAFARAAPEDVVTAHCFETLYHEIFNERGEDREQVLEQLKRWLDVRF